jgi:hypothetical protein
VGSYEFLSRPVEPQIFVDPSGRRAMATRRALRVAVLAFTAWIAALVLGATGFGGLPAPVQLVHRAAHALPAINHLARERVAVATHRPRPS